MRYGSNDVPRCGNNAEWSRCQSEALCAPIPSSTAFGTWRLPANGRFETTLDGPSEFSIQANFLPAGTNVVVGFQRSADYR